MEVIKLLWSCIDNRSSTSSSMRVFQPFAYPAASYCVSSYETEWNNHRCFINCNLEELSMSSRCYQSRWPEAIAASYRGTDIVSENWSMISSTKNWNDIVEARKAAGEWSEGTAKDWGPPRLLGKLAFNQDQWHWTSRNQLRGLSNEKIKLSSGVWDVAGQAGSEWKARHKWRRAVSSWESLKSSKTLKEAFNL